MNVFDWRGPEFLLFYAVFAAAVCLSLHSLRRASEWAQPVEQRTPLTDPYQIAYLRGGKNEAIRVAVISLIERGLLERREKNELIAKDRRPPVLNDPLERELLGFFQHRRAAPEAFKGNAKEWNNALAGRCKALEHAGLMPDAGRRLTRNWLTAGGVTLLLIVSAIKSGVGISRDRPGLFLVVFTVVAIAILLRVMFGYRRTRRGDAALADIREIFSGLKYSQAGVADLVMLGAVFGMAAMPAAAVPYLPELYPQAAKGGSDSGGCGSSCGSSCGGCGGGGCGGCGS